MSWGICRPLHFACDWAWPTLSRRHGSNATYAWHCDGKKHHPPPARRDTGTAHTGIPRQHHASVCKRRQNLSVKWHFSCELEDQFDRTPTPEYQRANGCSPVTVMAIIRAMSIVSTDFDNSFAKGMYVYLQGIGPGGVKHPLSAI